MDKFWEWMVSKGYAYKTSYGEYNFVLCINNVSGLRLLIHPMVGFFMSYLDEKHPKWIEEHIGNEDDWNFFELCKTTEERYNWLESKINELEAKR